MLVINVRNDTISFTYYINIIKWNNFMYLSFSLNCKRKMRINIIKQPQDIKDLAFRNFQQRIIYILQSA